MKIDVLRDKYSKIIIRTSGGAGIVYFVKDVRYQKSKDCELYYTLHRGYFRGNKLRVIGVDLIGDC